jgi:phosphoribosylformylglycinamidine synthase II
MNSEIIHQLNMTQSDYEEIVRRIQREPTLVELALFSAMWSEHCSYRSSKKYLSLFPTKGDQVIQGPGENAGIIKITDDLYLTFKVESHNHPSAVEPFQGAATGVGGIIRDIFTMGARPIASLDSLSFDYPTSSRAKYLLNGVVEGIAFYGNCVGVPTVGGETHFDSCYAENPLINAMSVGILKKENLRKSEAKTVGAKVIYCGAKTGRDGLHGASFASGNLDEEAQKKRGSVQVGDPFLEKLLIEATLQIIEEDLIEAIQDMGAAGLTSSSVEMAGKGGKGIFVDLDLIPLREQGMTPLEIMLSESQERMLLIAKEGCEDRIKEILSTWDLDFAQCGVITDTGVIELIFNGVHVCQMPLQNLLNPPENNTIPEKDPLITVKIPEPKTENYDLKKELIAVFEKPDFASKNWIYEQYDKTLFSSTIVPPGEGASLLKVKDTHLYMGLTLNSYGLLSAIDPFEGAKTIVSIAARRISALGLKPSAITNCLNFGDPTLPHTMYEFSKTIEGMCEALNLLQIPVVSGNVSFYNQGPTTRIYPTPTIGMVGLGPLKGIPRHHFINEGICVAILGETKNEIITSTNIPVMDMEKEQKVQKVIRLLIQNGLLQSVTSIDRGALWVALVKSMIPNQIGISIRDLPNDITSSQLFFSETNSRYLISFDIGKLAFIQMLSGNIPVNIIGETSKDCFHWEQHFDISWNELLPLYSFSFSKLITGLL